MTILSSRALRFSGVRLTRYSRSAISTAATGSSIPIELRPYQEQCLKVCTSKIANGMSRIGVSLPTGSGKTVVFLSLISRLQPPPTNPDATRVLIIVNSVELATQLAAQISKFCPKWTMEIEQGPLRKASGGADVTIATYQTLGRKARLEKYDPDDFKAVIVDEAHHAAAPSYLRILSHFDPDIKSPEDHDRPATSLTTPCKIPIIGFSGTFCRHEKRALGSVFSEIVFHRTLLDMIREKWLCSVKFTSAEVDIDFSKVIMNSAAKDFHSTSLAKIVNTPEFNRLVVQAWSERANDRKSTLVFCVDIAHVKNLTRMFVALNVDARYMYGETPFQQRNRLLEDFKQGKFPVLVNCGVLTEGADIPNIDCVVLARPTCSRIVFAQMIGRGLRLSPATGKTDCHIIDFVDSSRRIPSLVSVPSLFGLDPSGRMWRHIVSRRQPTTPQAHLRHQPKPLNQKDKLFPIPPETKIKYIDYADLEVLARDAFGDEPLEVLSNYAWVLCDTGIYVLECIGRGHIKIERIQAARGNEDSWQDHGPDYSYKAVYIPDTDLSQSSPKMRKHWQHVTTATTLAQAIQESDSYAEKKVLLEPGLIAELHRTAEWREEPATLTQQTIISKWMNKDEDLEKGEQIRRLTMGAPSVVICRLKHSMLNSEKQSEGRANRTEAREERERMARADRELRMRLDPGKERRKDGEGGTTPAPAPGATLRKRRQSPVAWFKSLFGGWS